MTTDTGKAQALELPAKVNLRAIPGAETVPASLDWPWVEASVWTERMHARELACALSALANGVKTGTWYSLIDKVFAPKTLLAAWTKVRANKGAAGVDGQSIEPKKSSWWPSPRGSRRRCNFRV